MDTWQVLGITADIVLKHGPDLIRLVHSIVHEHLAHPNPAIRAKALEMHEALHGDENGKPAA